MPIAEFIENVFFRIGYELRALIIGFNLPFDISRLAINHGPSRGRVMKGGFSFQLSPIEIRQMFKSSICRAVYPLSDFLRVPGLSPAGGCAGGK